MVFLEVPKGRFTFCSPYCVHEWKLRTQPAYLREQVLLRDRGICSVCGADTIAALAAFAIREAHAGRNCSVTGVFASVRAETLWDADHILPVVDGGGECDIENIRTLCLRCHRDATSKWRRASAQGALRMKAR